MAGRLTKVETGPNSVLYFEVDPDLRLRADQIQPEVEYRAAKVPSAEEIVERFDDLVQYISERSGQIVSSMRALGESVRPKKVTLEFSVGLEGTAGLPFLANGTASGNFQITAEWEFQ